MLSKPVFDTIRQIFPQFPQFWKIHIVDNLSTRCGKDVDKTVDKNYMEKYFLNSLLSVILKFCFVTLCQFSLFTSII